MHVGIIMDGNGRWATQRGLPRLEGHRRGVNALRSIVDAAPDLGITHVTFYTFSSENWKRPEDEVSGLMGMIRHHFKAEASKMMERNVRVRVFGDKMPGGKLPDDVVDILKNIEEKTDLNSGLTVNFCINYGGRDEIVRAAQCFVDDVEAGRRWVGDMDEALFSDYMDSRNQPDPDVIVRTGGDRRLSNFLLWQAAYAEFFFVDKFWPDFTPEDLSEIISEFKTVERKFGGLNIKS